MSLPSDMHVTGSRQARGKTWFLTFVLEHLRLVPESSTRWKKKSLPCWAFYEATQRQF